MAEAAKVLETGEETLEERPLPYPRATRVAEAVGVAVEELGTEEYQPYAPRMARGAIEAEALELEGLAEAECQLRATRGGGETATLDAEFEGETAAEAYCPSRPRATSDVAEAEADEDLGGAE